MTLTRWYELLLGTRAVPRQSISLCCSSSISVFEQKLRKGLRQRHAGKLGALKERCALRR